MFILNKIQPQNWTKKGNRAQKNYLNKIRNINRNMSIIYYLKTIALKHYFWCFKLSKFVLWDI